MIEKNAFMVIKVSLLTAHVRLSDCRRDCAVDRRIQFRKLSQLFVRAHNEVLVDISRVERFELLADADARWPHRLATATLSRGGLEAYVPCFSSVAASSSA